MKEEKIVIHKRELLTDFLQDRDSTIVQIGCGGTGSALVPLISRHIYDVRERLHRNIEYTIVDGDLAEKKNIARQNFIASDLGRNKAEVLAERYSAAFGLSIVAVPKYIPLTEEMDSLVNRATLIISCVDNNKTRAKLAKVYRTMIMQGYRNMTWIDVGNEKSSGQVFISGRYYDRKNGNHSMTCLTDIHPEINDETDKHPSEVSCAERAMSGEQTLAVNVLAAILVFNTITEMASQVSAGRPIFHYELMFSTNGSTRKRYGDDYEKEVLEAKKAHAKAVEDAKKAEEFRRQDEIWEVPVPAAA